jgi:hypothetical protein
MDRERMAAGRAVFDPIAAELTAGDDIDLGRMFGTEGLRVRGKVFAFVAHEGTLIAKVSQQRADELAASDGATRMIMRGREMREWVSLPLEAGTASWRALIVEARDFVDAITPR